MPQVEFKMIEGSGPVSYTPEMSEEAIADLLEEIADGRRSWVQLENQEYVNLAHVVLLGVFPSQD